MEHHFWKIRVPQTLFARSMLILVTPIFLTLAIALFVFFDRHWSTTTARLTDSLAGEISFIAQAWERETDASDRARLIDNAAKKLGLVIEFHAKDKLPNTRDLEIPFLGRHLNAALDHKLDIPYAIQRQDKLLVVSVAVKHGLLEIYVPSKRVFTTTTYVFLLFMLGSGLILSVVAVIFMRNQIRPIYRLAVVAEQFGLGIDAPRFKPTGAREIRRASEAFMEMRDRIKRQIRQRTDMLAGISHDLRTPLTRLKLQLAMLPKNIDTEAMHDDVAAMEKMIKGYLDFARGEALENTLRCDIVAILQEAVAMAERQGLKIRGDLPDTPIIVTVRPQAIQRVFTNILDNARLYAGNVCTVTLNKLSRSVEIIFDDNGHGIPENRREDVFKPFHRLDESRNQDIEGTGLGLTISRDLIQSHGGTIRLDTSPENGLRVILDLPL